MRRLISHSLSLSASMLGVLAVAVGLIGAGCKPRAQREPSSTSSTSSTTEITSVNLPGSSEETGGLNEYRESALADLANLDARLYRLELRAGDKSLASSDVNDAIAEARHRRDAIAVRVEGMTPSTWMRDRDDVQRQWEELSDIVERVGDRLSDQAR